MKKCGFERSEIRKHSLEEVWKNRKGKEEVDTRIKSVLPSNNRPDLLVRDKRKGKLL